MKKTALGISGTIESLFGLIMFVAAQIEISSNSKYTWKKPFTEYEFQFLMMRVIGIVILISGICSLLIWLYYCVYSERHVKDTNKVAIMGGTVKCAGCGLMVVANVSTCPRCGQNIFNSGSTNISDSVAKMTYRSETQGVPSEYDGKYYCSNCGGRLKEGDKFCAGCGHPVD